MARRDHRTAIHLACALLAISLTLPGYSPSAVAQGLSEQQIIDALTARPKTRSLLGGPEQPAAAQSPEDQRFIESLRHRTRSLTLTERERVSSIAKDKSEIDLEVYFDYNSAVVTAKAEPQLMSLGRALTSSQLKGTLVLVGGHTDAKGSDGYNQNLSERRAEAVKRYLIDKFALSAGDLSTAGYGKQHLKNANNPLAAENRRVQILNLETSSEARR